MYLGGKAPLEFGIGKLGSSIAANLQIGYAAKLAPNIFLEPIIGVIAAGGGGLFNIKCSFVMML